MALASASLLITAARPVIANPAAETPEADPRLVQNPALGRIAAVDPVEAQRLLEDCDRLLRQPASPRTRGNPFDLDDTDDALLAGNPLLKQLFIHDPAAAVALLQRVKTAGTGGRSTGGGK